MRRLVQMVAGACLLLASVGCCNFVTGVCDCEPHGCGTVPGFQCAGCNGSCNATTAVTPVAVARPDTLREMPKTLDR